MVAAAHAWVLTAPWYRWERAGVPRYGRGTAPVLQKFASDDFVNGFLADPQRSLRFDADADQVYNVQLIGADPGQFTGRLASLFPLRPGGRPYNHDPADPVADLRRSRLVGTGTRKIYRPSHGRHYLVVCELHCDAPGLPSVDIGQACQAGLVVRRRRLDVPEESRPEALALLRALLQAQAGLADLDEATPLRPRAAKARAARIARLKADDRFGDRRAQALGEVAEARDRLARWQEANGVRAFCEGWVPSAFEGVGAWEEVEERPQSLREGWFPLRRLFPDPRNPAHDARGRTLLYGVLPTGTLDVTNAGDPRFDDRWTYEVRCFVRRHDPHCPREGLNVGAPDCGGELVWSEPTERYRLASPFDLLGTANRPVTIAMPSLSELAAQAAARPLGRFSPVRFVQPQSLAPRIEGTSLAGGSLGGEAVCFFAIPLITLVALFVLNLFLPVVVFVFNLWFLLALKFCVPPSFKFEGALQAELALIPPQAGVDAGLAVDVDAAGFACRVDGVERTGAEIHGLLADDLAHGLAAAQGYPQPPPGDPNAAALRLLHDARASAIRPALDAYSNAPLVTLSNALHEQGRLAPPAAGSGSRLDLTGALQFEPRRLCEWKHEQHLPTTGAVA